MTAHFFTLLEIKILSIFPHLICENSGLKLKNTSDLNSFVFITHFLGVSSPIMRSFKLKNWHLGYVFTQNGLFLNSMLSKYQQSKRKSSG